MPTPLCENCQGRPARLVWTLDDGAPHYACGECGRPSSGVSVRDLASGEVAALVAAAPALPEWSTVAQVAARHHLSPKTIRKAIGDGQLDARGSKHQPYRIHRDAEYAWVEARRAGPKAAAKTGRGRRTPSAGSTFRDMARKS